MKKIILIVLSLISSVSLAATPISKPLIVVLDSFPNPDHAPLLIAEQQGYFKALGLTVKLIGPLQPSMPAKLVANNKADIGLIYQPTFYQQVDKGLPVIRIGTLIDKPLNCLVTLKSNAITSITDLKGKTIGVGQGGLTIAMLKTMFEKHHLSLKYVHLVTLKKDLAQALLTHQVDAVTGIMRNIDVPKLEAQNQQAITFFPEDNGTPNYSELIFITHTGNTNDKRLPLFLAAVKKAVSYIDSKPEESWQLFAKRYPQSNNPVNRDAWFATMPYFAEEPSKFDKTDWEHFAAYMQENKLIKQTQTITRYAVELQG
jgi:putative hydroxymethylpyrimidine transport system substrate-binding protein